MRFLDSLVILQRAPKFQISQNASKFTVRVKSQWILVEMKQIESLTKTQKLKRSKTTSPPHQQTTKNIKLQIEWDHDDDPRKRDRNRSETNSVSKFGANPPTNKMPKILATKNGHRFSLKLQSIHSFTASIRR